MRESIKKVGKAKGGPFAMADAGLGCGLGVGVGFGVGMFLKPGIIEEVA